MQEVAQGRVWTGKAAAKIGLVDSIGGLSRAIRLAKEAADAERDAKLAKVVSARHARFYSASPEAAEDCRQQQLAKLQMQLENTHNNFNMLEELRNKEEAYLEENQQKFAVQKQETAELKGQLYKNQSELDALSATLKQVELYNEEMKSEIAVTRRATYKAEENVTNLEKEK